MAFAMPLGQYISADTLLHRLDARLKLLILTAYLVGLFLIESWWGMALFMAILTLCYVLAQIPFRIALRGLKPLIVILVFTLLANALSFTLPTDAAPESIVLIGSFGIKPAGALAGLFLVLRIVALFTATALLTYTTALVALSDALVALMRPLEFLRVPTEDIAMMFSIALRFIPLTTSEAEQIMVAQQARGAVFNQGGLLKRTRAWLPVLVPLFVRLFRRADNLAAAMETRCYTGQGRTHLRESNLRIRSLVICLTIGIALIALGVLL